MSPRPLSRLDSAMLRRTAILPLSSGCPRLWWPQLASAATQPGDRKSLNLECCLAKLMALPNSVFACHGAQSPLWRSATWAEDGMNIRHMLRVVCTCQGVAACHQISSIVKQASGSGLSGGFAWWKQFSLYPEVEAWDIAFAVLYAPVLNIPSSNCALKYALSNERGVSWV